MVLRGTARTGRGKAEAGVRSNSPIGGGSARRSAHPSGPHGEGLCRETAQPRWGVLSIAVAAVLLMLCAETVFATRVMDITHLKGRRTNKLIGFGLVVGLQGTGDGGKYVASIAQLQK